MHKSLRPSWPSYIVACSLFIVRILGSKAYPPVEMHHYIVVSTVGQGTKISMLSQAEPLLFFGTPPLRYQASERVPKRWSYTHSLLIGR